MAKKILSFGDIYMRNFSPGELACFTGSTGSIMYHGGRQELITAVRSRRLETFCGGDGNHRTYVFAPNGTDGLRVVEQTTRYVGGHNGR